MYNSLLVTNGLVDSLLSYLDNFNDITGLFLFLFLFFAVSSTFLLPTISFSSRKLVKNVVLGITTGVAANLITQGLNSLGNKTGDGSSGNNTGGNTGGGSSGNNTGGNTGGGSSGNNTGGNTGGGSSGNNTGSNTGGGSSGNNTGGNTGDTNSGGKK
jgi:hypothetical protein